MAKRQKKAPQNTARTGEPLVTGGEAVETLPPVVPAPVAPEEPIVEGDGHALPPGLLSERETAKEASIDSLTPHMLLNGLSVEVGLYVLIFVVALIMRFIGLGARPLSQHEAAVAIGAWQFLQGQASGFVGSPFVFSTNLLLFFLGGPNDATVRILPALFGSALVLLPALLRRELGRTGSMISSILLLFSSTLVFFSRDSNGVEISVVSGFAAAVMMWRYIQIRRSAYLYFGMAGAAIALTASAAGFSMLIAGVVFALLFRWLTKSDEPKRATASASSNGPVEDPAFVNSIPSRTEWRNAVLLFAIIYVAVATAFSINREGLGAAFNLFGGWLASFQNVGPISSPLNLLPVYEPLSLVFGFAGLLLLASLRGSELRSRGVLIYFAIVLIIGSILYLGLG